MRAKRNDKDRSDRKKNESEKEMIVIDREISLIASFFPRIKNITD